jgi:hypothetical protein
VRFEGDGLSEPAGTDRVGYHAFPLAGTLNDQTRELPVAPGSTHRSTLPVGPEDQAPTATPPLAPAPAQVIAQRKAAVQPIFILLAIAAVAATLWTAAELLY